MSNLVGKVAVITGAGRGVGRAIAEQLGQEGVHVVLVARSENEINQLANDIEKSHGVTTLAIAADVQSEEDVQRVYDTTLEKFNQIDILVNNAGIGKYGPLEEMSVQDYDDMMNTNMRSTFMFCRLALPHMKNNKAGHILNLASVAGTKGLPNEAIYCATKFAQIGFSQALDHEARPHGVKVSSLNPGGINTTFAFGTGRTPGDPSLEEFLSPENVAEVALFILKQPENARIIDVLMRPMREEL
jgi:short-subunit dehydrogenase